MSLKTKILNSLNIKNNEWHPIRTMLLYSFFMGVGFAFFYTASTSLFLVNFEKEMLPYAYIVGGVLSYLTFLGFSKIERFFTYSRHLLIQKLFLMATISVFFVAFYISSAAPWVTFALFTWISIFAVIRAVAFWGIAAKIFDIRQGKRLFGLIGAGEVISNILSFFSVPFLLKFIQTEHLLYISFAGLIMGVVVFLSLQKRYRRKLEGGKKKASQRKKTTETTKTEPFYKNRYYLLVYVLAILPMFGIYFVDFVFFAHSKIEFPAADQLSSFLGIFFGASAIVEFLVKTFLSGHLISKYGLKFGLVALPVVLLFSIGMAALMGTAYGMAAAFFAFVTLSRLFMRVVRTSVNDPAFQILYQPIPLAERAQFQNKIEGGPKALGDAAAGAVLLGLSSLGFLNLLHFNYIFLAILIFWLKIAMDMYKEYRLKLKDILHKQKSETKSHSTESNFKLINKQILKTNKRTFLLYFNLLWQIEPAKTTYVLQNLLSNPSRKNKTTVLETIKHYTLIEMLPQLKEFASTPEALKVASQLNQVISQLEEARTIPLEEVVKLAQSKENEERVFAAHLLGYSSRYVAMKQVLLLLQDENTKVRNKALLASGRMQRIELNQAVIRNLLNPHSANTAASALKTSGNYILKDLDLFFVKHSHNIFLQRRIIRMFEEIGGEEAEKFLREKIQYPLKEIRDLALASLSKINFKAIGQERSKIYEEIDHEIATTVWIMASYLDLQNEKHAGDLLKSLEFEQNQKKERVFLLLSNLYEAETINLVRNNIRKGDTESVGYALEIIDMLVSENIKQKFLPLLEENTFEDLLEKYNDEFPQTALEPLERLQDIINKDFTKVNTWTKACAIRMLQHFPKQKTAQILLANILNINPLLSESAIWVLQAVNPDSLSERIKYFDARDKKNIIDIQPDKALIFDKIKTIHRNIYFAKIHQSMLITLAQEAITTELKTTQQLLFNQEGVNYFYIIISGQIDNIQNNQVINSYFGNDMLGEITELSAHFDDAIFVAVSDSKLLKIPTNMLYNLMATEPEITNIIVNMIKLQNITIEMSM